MTAAKTFDTPVFENIILNTQEIITYFYELNDEIEVTLKKAASDLEAEKRNLFS